MNQNTKRLILLNLPYILTGDPFPKKRTQSRIKKPNKMQR